MIRIRTTNPNFTRIVAPSERLTLISRKRKGLQGMKSGTY